MFCSDLWRHQGFMWYTYIHAGKHSYTYKKNKLSYEKWRKLERRVLTLPRGSKESIREEWFEDPLREYIWNTYHYLLLINKYLCQFVLCEAHIFLSNINHLGLETGSRFLGTSLGTGPQWLKEDICGLACSSKTDFSNSKLQYCTLDIENNKVSVK